MSHSLASLERALEQVAREFAVRLIKEMLAARVDDVAANLKPDALRAGAVASAVGSALRALPIARARGGNGAARGVLAPGAPRAAHTARGGSTRPSPGKDASRGKARSRSVEARARPAAGTTRPRPAPSLARTAAADVEAFHEESPENVITDPSVLLGVLGDEAAAPVPAHRERAERERPMSELLSTADEKHAAAAEASPVLKPGERLQRTAGGSVVLRRRGH